MTGRADPLRRPLRRLARLADGALQDSAGLVSLRDRTVPGAG
jgi:hypothetical protein